MNNKWLRLCCSACAVGLALMLTGAAPGAPQGSPLARSQQVLLVLTDGWDAVSGTAQRFERDNPAGPWKSGGAPWPIVVGRNGLAWGRGLHAPADAGPSKKEGDGKAPAGVFGLALVFGQSDAAPARLAMPYRSLGDNVECVDDSRSSHYNQLTTRREAGTVDWNSSEKMWQEPLYKWGVVVLHNADRQPAGGSCIFLHVWRGPASGTAGCTAMAEPNLTSTIAWLDARKNPVVVQLPREQYTRLKAAWKLP